MLVERKQRRYFVFLAILLIPMIVLSGISLGSIKFSMEESLLCVLGECKNTTTEDIIWKIRMPRTLSALIGGAGLALAGTLLQSLFRNPLASPGILGITSGASLGVAILIMGGMTIGITAYSYGFEILFTAALVGALLTTMLIIGMTRFVSNTTTLLLVGLMINWFLGSIIIGNSCTIPELAGVLRMDVGKFFWNHVGVDVFSICNSFPHGSYLFFYA